MAVDLGSPPSGVLLRFRRGNLSVVLRPSVAVRALVGGVWQAGTVLLVLEHLWPRALGLGLCQWLSLPVWLVIWLIGSLLALHVLLLRTIIEITPETFTCEHRPWHLPLAVTVRTPDIQRADLDTKVKVHRHHGMEYETYTFSVMLSLASTYENPVLYVTSDEAQAVFLRQCIGTYLEGLPRSPSR